MPKSCRVWINGEQLTAKVGDLLLDVALMNGIELSHDCRSGYCGACQVRVVAGRCLGAHGNSDVVHACQTRIISDLRVAVENAPEIVEVSGNVVEFGNVAPDVLEVCVESRRPVRYIPGQYLSLQFRGFPARYYSPTVPLDWPNNPDLVRFHVRQLPTGRVSSALGRRIKRGHRVKMKGPFGAAHFRPKEPRRLVLVSGGTGFAPIWAIAEAAIREKPMRELVLIAGVRELASLYMIPALCRLALFPYVTIITTVLTQQSVSRAIRHGQPANYLPPLSTRDIVYVAGPPALAQTVGRIAQASGTSCFADPFLPSSDEVDGKSFLSRTAEWFVPTAQHAPPLELFVGRH
jgi:3-phenylpropionate/trans-cinnamate dioxygenase ferredoxin reductase subunit